MPRHSTNETNDTTPNSGISSEPTYAALGQFPGHKFTEQVIVKVPTLDNIDEYVYSDAILQVQPSFTPNGGFSVQMSLGDEMSPAPWFIVRRVVMPGAILNDEPYDSSKHIFTNDFRAYVARLGALDTTSPHAWRYDGWVPSQAGGRDYVFWTEMLKLTPQVAAQQHSQFRFSQIALAVRSTRVLLKGWTALRSAMPPNQHGGTAYGHVRMNRARFHNVQFGSYDIKIQAANSTGQMLESKTFFEDVWPPDTVNDHTGQVQPAFPLQAKMFDISPSIPNSDPLVLGITVDQTAVDIP